jgi:hypothetical protein
MLDEVFDDQLVFHGFTRYVRDYELVVYQPVDPNNQAGLVPRHLSLLFRYCTEAGVRSRVRPDVWAESLDDSLVDQQTATRQSAGYVWGIEGQVLYPFEAGG